MCGNSVAFHRSVARTGGSRSNNFRTLVMLHLALVVLASSWLFLSNLDQLWPAELTQCEATRSWRGEELKAEFAGGFWRRADFWRSVNLSLLTATLTACIAALVGIPAAWALARRVVPSSSFVETIVSSIIVLPASSIGLALILTFQYGPWRMLQDWLDWQVMYSIVPGMIVAQLVLSLAFGMTAWRSAFEAVNPRLETIARSLGASPWKTFRLVTLPLAAPGLVAGFVLAWVRAIAEFGAVLLFCGTFRELPAARFGALARLLRLHQADQLSLAMWTEIEYGNVEYGYAIGFALAGIAALCVYAVHRMGVRSDARS